MSRAGASAGRRPARVAPRVSLPRTKTTPPEIPDRTLAQVLGESWEELGFTRVFVSEPAPPAAEPSRWDVPQQLPGTGMLSAYPELDSEITLVRLLKSQAWLFEPLEKAAAELQPRIGQKRMAGCWALAFFGWVDSGEADVQPWYGDAKLPFWQECGFAYKPSYKTVQRRFVELELIADKFADALTQIVQHARKQEPRIGTAVAIDATMVASNARPHRIDDTRKIPKRIADLPLWGGKRLPTDTADDIRRAIVAEAPDAKVTVGEYLDRTDEITVTWLPGFKGRIGTTHNGKKFIVLDPDGGFRVYQRGNKAIVWWFGYYLTQPVDHFTGLPLRAVGFPADENESKHFAETIDAAAATTGRDPFFVSTDKACSVADCFEEAALRGITLVAPYRPAGTNAPARAEATVFFDEHGIPFCRHCLCGTDQVAYELFPPKTPGARPRSVIRVKCSAPRFKACEGVQEWSLMLDPTRLLPVSRTHPAYIETRTLHQTFERSHNEARARSNSKPRHFETRSKHVSLTLTVMRADTGALIAWLRASVINGWLGLPALNPELGAANSRLHEKRRKRKIALIQEATLARRLRLGRTGGGRYPPRNRGGPTRRPTDTND